MSDKITYGVGAHEPIFHRLRTGNSTAEEWERWKQETSRENLDLLAELGVTKVLIACSKGFGLEFEKPLVERAARFAEEGAKRGIRTNIYVQGFPVYYETFLLELPRAEAWLARRQDGDSIPWGGQTFRRWIDPTVREFWEYEKKLLEYILRQFTPCEVFMDNTSVHPSYTDSSRESFRDYLRARYTGDEAMRQFGIPGFDAVDLPRFDPVYYPPDAYRIVKDPILQEWARWRSRVIADFLGEMHALVHRLAPATRFNSGVGACDGLRYNQLFTHGMDFEDRLAVTDKSWMEESGWRPGVVEQAGGGLVVKDERHPDQAGAGEKRIRISTDARWWKIYSNYGGSGHGGFWGETDRASKLVALGHNFAFAHKAHHLGTVAPLAADRRMLDDIRDVVEWGNQHVAVLAGRETRVAPVAVWRGTSTLGFIRHTPVWEACAIEQMLFEQHLPFTILFDGGLERFCRSTAVSAVSTTGILPVSVAGVSPASSSGSSPANGIHGRDGHETHGQDAHATLILPGTQCVSDRQVQIITDFVQQGGRLLLLGPAGTRDERTRLRRKYAFEHLFGGQVPNLEHFGPPHWVPELNWGAMPGRLTGSFGKGQVAMVKTIAPVVPLDLTRDPYMPERQVMAKDILPPANEAAIMAELNNLCGPMPRVDAPRWTLAEYWRRGKDLLICLCNLHKKKDGGPVTVHLGPYQAKEVVLHALLENDARTAPVVDGQVRLARLERFVAVEVKDVL